MRGWMKPLGAEPNHVFTYRLLRLGRDSELAFGHA